MKRKHLKSLVLKKKSIANITSNEVTGGVTTTSTIKTIQDLTKSCPHVCGSKK